MTSLGDPLEPLKVPDKLWRRNDMRDALAGRDMRALFLLLRQYCGASQTRIGMACGMAQSHVSAIMRGQRVVTDLATFERIADGLSMPAFARQLLGLAPQRVPSHGDGVHGKATSAPDVGVGSGSGSLALFGDGWTRESNETLAGLLTAEAERVSAGTATRVAHEWLVVEPPQVHELRFGRKLGAGLIAEVEARVHHLRRLDDFLGGGDLHDLVDRELTTTITLLKEGAYSEADGRRLLAAVGELCQLAGWVAADAGAYDRAERFHVAGTKAAHAAGDAPLAANLLSTLSYQKAGVGDPREAAVLARTAYRGAEHYASPLARALLLERVAWADAKAGDGRSCDRALGRADDAFACHEPGDGDPSWVYWLDRSEMDVMAGRCYTELGRPAAAEPLLRGAIDAYDTSHTRETALYLSWLAEAYAQAGEVDQACVAATRCLTLSSEVNSARAAERVDVVRARLHSYRATAAVRQFDHIYRSTTRP